MQTIENWNFLCLQTEVDDNDANDANDANDDDN